MKKGRIFAKGIGHLHLLEGYALFDQSDFALNLLILPHTF